MPLSFLVKLIQQQERIEDDIYKRETEYLEDTPYGNILTGFDNYIKGSSSSAPGGRRKPVTDDSNRVFSNSSTRWNDMTVSALFTYQCQPCFLFSGQVTNQGNRIRLDFLPLVARLLMRPLRSTRLFSKTWPPIPRMQRLRPQRQQTRPEQD